MNSRETAILITLVIYKIALIAIGFLTRERMHSEEDFFLGGRRLGPLVAAISASASSSSAWTLVGVSGAAYAWGFGAVWLIVGCVGGFCINWFFVARRLMAHSRVENSLTVTEVLSGPAGTPFGVPVRVVSSLIVVLGLGGYVASQFVAAGEAFTRNFDMGFEGAVILGAGIIVFYTLLGGFWAVSVTDTLQGLVMMGTSILLPVGALIAVGGPTALIEGMEKITTPGFLELFRGFESKAAIGFVAGVLGIGLGYPGQPHVVNRFMAMDDARGNLARARVYAIGWAVFVYSGMVLLGWCARILVPGEAENHVFIAAATNVFPPVVAGVMVAALLSAIMSTADSQLLVAASAITHDLRMGTPSRGPDGAPRHLVLLSRICVVIISVAAVLVALFVKDRNLFSLVLAVFTPMGNAFGPTLIILISGRSLSRAVVFWLILVGFLASFWLVGFADAAGFKGLDRFVFPIVLTLLAWCLSRRRSS